jgi:hypothetical protein
MAAMNSKPDDLTGPPIFGGSARDAANSWQEPCARRDQRRMVTIRRWAHRQRDAVSNAFHGIAKYFSPIPRNPPNDRTA